MVGELSDRMVADPDQHPPASYGWSGRRAGGRYRHWTRKGKGCREEGGTRTGG